MNPRRVGALVSLVVGCGPLAAASAGAGSVVVLVSSNLDPYTAAAAGFRAGYQGPRVELMLDSREPAATRRQIEAAFPQVIVAIGAPAAEYARERFPRVPLVYGVVHDPERYDLTGEWVTGVTTDVPERLQLDALHSLAPEVRRVALVRGAHADADRVRAAKAAGTAIGVEIVDVPVAAPSAVAAAARDIVPRVGALWLPADRTVASPEVFRFLLQLSLEHHLPLLVFSEALVHAGALVAVAPDYAWVGGRAADLVRRITNGDRAGDLPPAPLERTRVVVNAATARALGRDPAPAASEPGATR